MSIKKRIKCVIKSVLSESDLGRRIFWARDIGRKKRSLGVLKKK